MNQENATNGLGERGRAFWEDLTNEYDYDAHSSEMLLEACRVLDVIDALQTSVTNDGVMVKGSQGQLVVNGAVSELRQQQATWIRLVQNLGLDEEEAGESSRKASAAANARWRNKKKGS